MPVDVLRTEIDRRLRTRRFLRYCESRSGAIEGAPVVEDLREAVTKAPTAELVALIERAAGHVVKVGSRAYVTCTEPTRETHNDLRFGAPVIRPLAIWKQL